MKELASLFKQMKVVQDERKSVYDIIDGINDEINEAESKKSKAEKKVHPKINKLDMIDKAIK